MSLIFTISPLMVCVTARISTVENGIYTVFGAVLITVLFKATGRQYAATIPVFS